MFNRVTIAGHLTKDIEIRYANSGTAFGGSGIASSKKFKTQSGEQKEEVLFVDITFFGRTAEIANQYLRKGSKVLVEGELKLDQWTAQDGSKRSKHSVKVTNLVMLGNKDENSSGAPAQNGYSAPAQNNYQAPAQNGGQAPAQNGGQGQPSQVPEIDINEDEIPF